MDQQSTITDQAFVYLDTLFSGKPDDWHALLWTQEDKQSRWFTDLCQMANCCNGLTEGNVFTGMSLQPQNLGRHQRGTAAQSGGIVCLFGDFDYGTDGHKKDNHPATFEATVEMLSKFEVSPTLLAHSGHGLQAYWCFKEPWLFDTETERGEAITLLERWTATWKTIYASAGYGIDSVWDLARVLRVPGTWNRKPDLPPALCRLLKFDGPRINPGDLDDLLLRNVPPSYSSARTVNRRDHVANDGLASLIISEDAAPPLKKFEVLRENDPLFLQAVNRKSKKGIDRTPSGWDFTLIGICLRAGWTDQEIADLLIYVRVRQGEDPKLREDYYARSIANCRDGMEGPGEDGRSDEPEDAAAGARAMLKQKVGLEIDRIERFVSDKAYYRIFLIGEDHPLDFGSSEDFLLQPAFRLRLAETRKQVLPLIHREVWNKVSAALFTLLVDVDAPDELTQGGIMQDRIDRYLYECPPSENSEDAVMNGRPIKGEDGEIWIFLPHFCDHLRNRYGDRNADVPTIGTLFRKIGIPNKSPKFSVGGKRTTRSVWVVKGAE